MFAAAFFLLGDSLKDCINVLLRNLNDFQLAIAIARVYEGSGDEVGPVLKMILEETVLPLAFREGFRWLASWAFWMLKRRDLAIQTIVVRVSSPLSRFSCERTANALPSAFADSIGGSSDEVTLQVGEYRKSTSRRSLFGFVVRTIEEQVVTDCQGSLRGARSNGV